MIRYPSKMIAPTSFEAVQCPCPNPPVESSLGMCPRCNRVVCPKCVGPVCSYCANELFGYPLPVFEDER